MKLTIFKHVAVLSGTGVGGGSSVYANTLPIPKSTFFKTGSWSKLHDLENELAPYYEEALRMPGGAKNPNYLTALLGKSNSKIGNG
jgi:cholesterol oxidase